LCGRDGVCYNRKEPFGKEGSLNDSNPWKPPANWKVSAEKLILSLRDIVGASITLDPETQEITEVSILAEGNRPPKQIVRDVRSALRAEYQVDLDYRRISVAQKRGPGNLASPEPDASEPETEPTVREPHGRPAVLSLPGSRVREEPASGRLAFRGVTVAIEEHHITVRVNLGLGERETQGEATGINSRFHAPRLVAEATLDAVGRFLEGPYRLALGDVQVVKLAADDVAVVSVRCFKDRMEMPLTGSAVVESDLQQGIVYATLDSLNRILGRLRYREPVEFELRPTTIS